MNCKDIYFEKVKTINKNVVYCSCDCGFKNLYIDAT